MRRLIYSLSGVIGFMAMGVSIFMATDEPGDILIFTGMGIAIATLVNAVDDSI